MAIGNIEYAILSGMFGSMDIECANNILDEVGGDADEFADWLRGACPDTLVIGDVDIVSAVYEFLIGEIDTRIDVTAYVVEKAQEHLYSNCLDTQIDYDLYDDDKFRALLIHRVTGKKKGLDNSELLLKFFETHDDYDTHIMRWVCNKMGLSV